MRRVQIERMVMVMVVAGLFICMNKFLNRQSPATSLSVSTRQPCQDPFLFWGIPARLRLATLPKNKSLFDYCIEEHLTYAAASCLSISNFEKLFLKLGEEASTKELVESQFGIAHIAREHLPLFQKFSYSVHLDIIYLWELIFLLLLLLPCWRLAMLRRRLHSSISRDQLPTSGPHITVKF